jgi:hypothetical protein
MYCTLNELIDELETPGVRAWKETQWLDKIRAASEWIDKTIGNFIPITEARRFDGEGGIDLAAAPLLAVTSIVDDELTLTVSDYLLYPRQRLWENGPYCRITIDPDAPSLSVWSAGDDIIVVTGRWGMYELTKSTGATASQATSTETSLVVDNAANIGPGAALLIGTEQELVEATGSSTDSTANLGEDLDASEEEIDLSDGTKVNIGETIRIDFEQMKVRDKQTNTALVERGWNGTKRTTHANAADVYAYRTFTVKRGANGTTAAAHTSAAVSRYVVPDDITHLCRKMAALKLKSAQSGFAGKIGNAELGEVSYFKEFPEDDIKKVMSNYFVPVL